MNINKIRLPIMWIDREELSEDEEIASRALGREPKKVKRAGTVVVDLDAIESWHAVDNTTRIYMLSGNEYDIDIDEPGFCLIWSKFNNDVPVDRIQYIRVDENGEEQKELDNEEDEEDDFDGDI